MVTYNYGWEAFAEIGVEDPANYGTAVAGAISITYLRSCSFTVSEGVEAIRQASSSTGRQQSDFVKGPHAVSGTLTFWLPNEGNSAAMTDLWILKLGLDAFNVAYTANIWEIPNVGTSAYASNSLLSFTLNVGHNKAGAIQRHVLSGCVANTLTITAKKGEKVEFKIDFLGQKDSKDSTAFDAPSKSTYAPYMFSDCIPYFANDGTVTSRAGEIIGWEVVFNNNVEMNYSLHDATTVRTCYDFICGLQQITGTITVNMSTTAGLDFYQYLLNDVASPYTATDLVKKAETQLIMAGVGGERGWAIRLRNIVIGEIVQDIDFTKVQELPVPFIAQYYNARLNTDDSTAPANWDSQS